MDLILGSPRKRFAGPSQKRITAEFVRELVPEDLVLWENTRKPSSTPTPIKRLRERHHQLARALAAGMTVRDAAIMTGYHEPRVSMLLGDPSFKNLVEFYREKKDAAFLEMAQMLSGLSLDAVEELRTRLEDNPDDLSIKQLIELVKLGADRTGYGPSSSTTQNVNVTVGLADRLEKARERAKQARLVAQDAEIISPEDD